ncbi:MAG TPA: hypothetical protein PLV89_02680 [Treponemataceae bacterium]|jgi:nucleoid-associated protein YgaU|nr:hypothetical protein [Spirochaetaceae bacterium]HOE07759.1 hypothetical protein [Treponemataceae bacterium]
MKKRLIALFICFIAVVSFVCAGSYVDNEYNQLAKRYTAMAEQAFDEGEYDLAVEYTVKAEENADLSQAYIAMMLNKADAEKQIRLAKNQKLQAERMRGPETYPMAFSAGDTALANAEDAFTREDYISSSAYAIEAIQNFAGIKEVTPLPKFYVVRPWTESKDCFWNISGRAYVYNNPLLWENLYQANKGGMKDPSDPDVIYPGMKIEIPSISGEFREGTYNPSTKYEAFTPGK